MKRSAGYIQLLGLTLAFFGCVHSSDDKEAPEIYANMPLQEALQAGIDHGSETLKQVQRLIKRRNERSKAGPIMLASLQEGMLTLDDRSLMNASHLYLSTAMPGHLKLFQQFVRTDRKLANRMGWRLAAVRPSATMQKAIDLELTRALETSEEERVLIPEMADAVAKNNLTDAYTMVREGLMRVGGEEFVNAMIALDVEQASWDFLFYLAKASPEELRQLTLVQVDMFSCVAILRHLQRKPVSISHPTFGNLFSYAVSRNRALGELAQEVLSQYVPTNTEHLANLLAKKPSWLQIAYLENARRNMTPQKGLVISELANTTAKQDVIEEIKDLKL